MIKIRHTSFIYDDEFEALKDINLEIKHGEFVSLVGPSGSGKSTLLKLLTREILPSEGEILIDGVNIVDLPQGEIPHLRRKIGTVYQDFKLLSAKTAF